MLGTMRLAAAAAIAALPACESVEEPLLRTEYVEYRGQPSIIPCGATGPELDRKVDHLFGRIEASFPEAATIEYNWFGDTAALPCDGNVSGCAREIPPGVEISSIYPAQFHELAHAAHLLTIGSSHDLLSEGFASYFSNDPPPLKPDGAALFRQDVEQILAMGAVPGAHYPTAAHFVGATIERHGLATFRTFWARVGRQTTTAEFRSTYEAVFSETWAAGLAASAQWDIQVVEDLECTGELHAFGSEPLRLQLAQTCVDPEVRGPILFGSATAAELPLRLDLAEEGMYRFTVTTADGPGESSATFRGCYHQGAAPTAPLGVFFSGKPATMLLGPGRYRLGVRIPLVRGAAGPVDLLIERVG